MGLLSRLRVPIGWAEVARRTVSLVIKDDVLGWAAELAFYFFLALFPALLFLVALASFFPVQHLTEKIARTVGLGSAFRWSWELLQWPVIAALIMTALGFVYYTGPDVQQKWKWITPGTVVGTVLWLLASLGFKWYVSAFGTYQKTYGTIGGAMVALLWFYVSGLAMLIGAEVNAVIEHASPLGKDPGERRLPS